MYTTTSYVSRYFPALDTILTFPVVYYGYRNSSATRANTYPRSNKDFIENESAYDRPSVIKFVPKFCTKVATLNDEVYEMTRERGDFEKESFHQQLCGLEERMLNSEKRSAILMGHHDHHDLRETFEGVHMCNEGLEKVDCESCCESTDGGELGEPASPLNDLMCSKQAWDDDTRSTLNDGVVKQSISEMKAILDIQRHNVNEAKKLSSNSKANEVKMPRKNLDKKAHEAKRHQCKECGTRFKKPSALIIHMRTHSGEKPYACEICDKKFSISGNLRRHMFTHTGEKPYKCKACGRGFNNPSHLARHSKKIHIQSLINLR